jgi:hypothetical protein
MRVLFVVDRAQQWPFEIPGSSVVTAGASSGPAHAFPCSAARAARTSYVQVAYLSSGDFASAA